MNGILIKPFLKTKLNSSYVFSLENIKRIDMGNVYRLHINQKGILAIFLSLVMLLLAAFILSWGNDVTDFLRFLPLPFRVLGTITGSWDYITGNGALQADILTIYLLPFVQ